MSGFIKGTKACRDAFNKQLEESGFYESEEFSKIHQGVIKRVKEFQMSQSLIEQIEKRVYHNEISLVAGRDHLSVEEKSYIRFGHDRCFILLMPIIKKLIDDNDKTIRINYEYYGGGDDQIETRNKSLLKLLVPND